MGKPTVTAGVAVVLLASCPAAQQALVGGSASGSASVQVGATVSVPDPPENTAAPVDDLEQPDGKLSGCASGDVAAALQIVKDFRDSCHEMIICGGLTNSFGVSIVSVLLGAALGKDLKIGTIEYQGNGTYKVGDVMVMTLVLGRDTSWGRVGDVIPFDVMALDSYFTRAKVKATGGLDLVAGGARARTMLAVEFESVGPGIELLGLGASPASGVSFDFHEVARSIGGAIQVSNVITVDDQHGDSHIAYRLSSAPIRFGELLGHAAQQMDLVDVSGTRGGQRIEVTHWGMQFQPGSSGTLDGAIDFAVKGGDFDYVVHFEYPHRKEPDVRLSCQ
jgi:hypothetical protein